MKNAVGIGIGAGASVAVIILIFVMMNGTGIGEVADSATMKVNVNYLGYKNAHTLDFIFNFHDKDGNPVRADGVILVTIMTGGIDMSVDAPELFTEFEISEKINFKKNEFIATQNEFGTKIIKLRKEIPLDTEDKLRQLTTSFERGMANSSGKSWLSGKTLFVIVSIETGGKELSFDFQEILVP